MGSPEDGDIAFFQGEAIWRGGGVCFTKKDGTCGVKEGLNRSSCPFSSLPRVCFHATPVGSALLLLEPRVNGYK